MAADPKIDDKGDWKAEYEQLSEDFRHLRNTGGQAAIAALAVDGVILVPVQSLLLDGVVGGLASAFLLAVGGALSIFMSIDVFKWIARGDVRIKRLARYDELAGFGRYYPDEKGYLKWHTGSWLASLVGLAGVVLILAALYVVGYTFLPYAHA